MSNRSFSFPPAVPPLPSWNGWVTPQQFGGGASASAAQNLIAFQAANDHLVEQGGGVLQVPPGTYDLPDHTTSLTPVQQAETCLNLGSHVTFENHGTINGAVLCIGDYIEKTDTVLGTGTKARAVSSFSGSFGDFSGYAPGDLICVELQGVGGTVSSELNQQGVDFLVVATANDTTLTTTTPTRWSYNTWKISKLANAINVDTTLARDDYTIPGDYTALFDVGDWVRIENLEGDDTPYTAFGATPTLATGSELAYYQYLQVKTISASEMTFKQRFAFDFDNVWLVRAAPKEDVTIRGGYIQSVITEAVRDIRYDNIDCEEFGYRYNFDFFIGTVRAQIEDGPFAFRNSNSYSGVIQSIIARGSESTSGNANLKFTSMVDVTVTSAVADDVTSSSSGCFGFQTDFYITPYANWMARCIFQGINAGNPKGTTLLSAYITGCRDCAFDSIVGGQEIRFAYNDATTLDSVDTSGFIRVSESIGGAVRNFSASFVRVTGWTRGILDSGRVWDGADNNNRCIEFGNGTNIPTNDDCRVRNVDCFSTTAADAFLYIQDSPGLIVQACSDILGISDSLILQATTSSARLLDNTFQNTVTPGFINIAAGVVDLTNWYLPEITIDVEGSVAASDNLDTINGMDVGRYYILKIQSAARNVVLKHGTGNLELKDGVDQTLSQTTDRALLYYDGLKVRDLFVGGLDDDASQSTTISGGVVTLAAPRIHLLNLAGEGGAADDLATLNGGSVGQILTICASSSSVTITVKDNTDNFRLAGDCVLDNFNDTLTVMWNGLAWRELSRSDNDV